MTLTEQHAAAGEAYAAAAKALAEAYTELLALDLATNHAAGTGFGEPLRIAGHSPFLPNGAASFGDLVGRAHLRIPEVRAEAEHPG